MSHTNKSLKIALSLLFVAVLAINCGRSSGQTQFAKNLEADKDKPALSYDQWVALVGQDKTDALYAGIGQDSLNLLSYGIGQSNMVQLINQVTTTAKLVALIGSDFVVGFGPGARTGLGVIVTQYLILQVDAQMQINLSTNLIGGGAVPSDQDTITNLANVVNTLSTAEVTSKMVNLFGRPALNEGFDLSRNLAVNGIDATTPANQILYVQRMAKVVAHVEPTVATCALKICPLMTGLTAAEITQKLAPMIKGVTSADKLVETIQSTTAVANLITVIQGVTVANITAKMVPIINAVTDCTKMGYTINGVTTLATLVNIINNVQVPANMGNLLNLAEDASTWASQVSPAETWGVPVKQAPFGTAGAGATLTYTVAGGTVPIGAITLAGGGGTNYLPGVTATVATCGVQPTLHLNVLGGIIQATGHYATTAGTGCTNGVQALTVTTPATSKTTMARLVDIINGLAPAATYYKLLNMVDGVSDMNKMVRLIQDLKDASDVYDLVNNLSGVVGATCTVANGTDTVSIVGGGGAGAAATAFIVGNQVAYIRVSAQGAGYTSQPTISVPGCTLVTYTATGPIAGGAPITQITANNPMNNLTQVVELLSLANLPRLQQVMDGQRTFDNVGNQAPAATVGTYLYKLGVLMVNLNQASEGPLKVGDLINGVTNTDKIIDLIYDVTTTTNLSAVINGIFKSTEVDGCSDSTAGTYTGVPGAGNTTAVDTGTCENSGSGAFYGERDRAVTTLVYLVENVASSAKLVSMIDNITPANVILLVNHTATYSQHADGTAHVYPRGVVGLDAQAAGKRLAKIVDNTTTITQLNFVANNVSSIIKMAKLVSFMDIGVSATTGVGKLPIIINAVTGANAYLSTTVPGRGNPTGNATGMGKMVNVIDFISGATPSAAMVQLKNLMNDITDIYKMADLINQTVNSSNIVGLLNGVTDPRYGTSTTDLVTMLNNLPRGEISKMVNLIGEIGNANGTATATFPGPDHILIAQLMAANTAQSNVATADLTFVPASDNVTWTAHGLTAADVGRPIIFSNIGGTMPGGITAGQLYYMQAFVDANNIRITAIKGGAALDITSTDTGDTRAYMRGITSTSGVGPTVMSQMIGTLGINGAAGASGVTGGANYTTAPAVGGLNAGGGTGATATALVPSAVTPVAMTGAVTRVTLTGEGVCTAAPTGATVGGGGTGATVGVITAPTSASAVNFKVKAVYLTNGGSGYTASTLTFTGGTCGTPPTATTTVNGVMNVSVTAGGTGYTDSFTGVTFTGGGGAGATATALVAGPLNTTTGLTSFYGGTGYVTGQICPIIGAGGSGGTCTVTAGGGTVTACSAMTAGTGYIDGQIVSIGGSAKARATVVAGAITGFTIDNSGCGYVGVPSVRVLTGANECGVAGAAHTAVMTAGRLTSITVGAGWTGCPSNPTVIIGDNPYMAYGDGASAIVNAVVGGTVVAITLSPSADNLAQLLVNTEKGPGEMAITYNGTTPNISAREAMVRMIQNGVYHTSTGYNPTFLNIASVNYPGVGPAHIAQNVLGNLSSAGSVMSVINLLNSDSTSLTDMIVLIGCGDHVEYAFNAPLTDNDHHAFCSGHAPSLW